MFSRFQKTLKRSITKSNLVLFSITLKMKKRVSATIDEKTEKIIKEILKKGTFRNKSHVIEEAIKLLKEKRK